MAAMQRKIIPTRFSGMVEEQVEKGVIDLGQVGEVESSTRSSTLCMVNPTRPNSATGQ